MSFDVIALRRRLPDRDIHWFATIGSTMHEASRLADLGCATGTVVVADQQTAGQGRQGHTWHSEQESGLYLSVVLRLPNALPPVTLALGLATVAAVAETTDLVCDIRWPNDVLLQDKKCAGILVQLHNTAVIAGIGINVNQTSFPGDLAAIATSLRIATGRAQSRENLLINLLTSIDAYCKILVEEGTEPILQMFSHASSYVRGRQVIVDQGEVLLRGITAGLDPGGFLLLQAEDGKRHIILAGGVRPAG